MLDVDLTDAKHTVKNTDNFQSITLMLLDRDKDGVIHRQPDTITKSPKSSTTA
jgi:hypothetical protein